MFNKMKRFMAILLSLTMLLSAMPMNALAETFSSGWTSAVDDGISLLAEGNYTVRVGQTITIEGSSGYSHYWYVDDDAQNTGSVILTNTGSRTVRVEGVTEGTVTLVHYYQSNGRYRIQTFTVQVTALEASMQYIYLYVQVGGNTDGLTINSDGWYTVGYITHKIPDGDDVHDSYWSEDNRYTYGEPYLDGVVAAVSPGAITLYPTNANVFTDEVLNSIDWTDYGLNISGGASDYVSDSTSWEWHLDGHLQIDYKILIEQWIECEANEERAEWYNGKWYKQYGITGFYAYSDGDFGHQLTAEGLAASRPIDNYEFVSGDPESIRLNSESNNNTVKLYYNKQVGDLTVEKAFGENSAPAEEKSFNLDYVYTADGEEHTGTIVATWNPDTQSFAYSSESDDVTDENTLAGLPVGTQVTITERAADASGYDVSYTPSQTAIIAQGEQTVTVTNTVSTGSLTLVKAMAADSAAPSAGDSFNLEYSYDTEDGKVTGTVVATWNGTETGFTYTIDGETGNTIDGIPVGTTVTISESGADNYKASYSGDVTVSAAGDAEAIIDADGQTVTLTNTRKLGRIGYNLVRQDATINTTGWSFYEYSGTDAPKYTVDNEWYANGDQYEVTDRIPTSDGYIFVGWFDKAFSQAGGVNDPAEILHAGEYNTYNRELTDERVQTLDAIWATLAVENAVYVYDEQAHTIPTPNGGYSLEGLDLKYQDQIESENLVRVSDYKYATSENGTYSTTLPTFTEVGVHEVWVKATVTAGSRSTEIVKRATVTIYPRLVVEKTLAEGETATDEAFTFVLTKDGEPVPGAEYVVLNSEGAIVETKTTGTNGSFTLAAGQTATFTGEGIDIASYPGTYTVTEDVENGWVAQLAQTANLDLPASGNEVELTFTNSRSTQQITITKTWEDGDNQDGLRPEPSEFSVTLTDETNSSNAHTVSSWAESSTDSNVWTATITVPAYTDDGEKITYTVSESAVEGYTTSGDESVTPADDTTVVITNTHTTATTSVSVKKVWNDGENVDGVRPASVTVALYANGKQQGEAVTLNAENQWTHKWTNLAVYENGTAIEYEVYEMNGDTAVQEGGSIPSLDSAHGRNYTVSYSNSGNAWTITNKYTPQRETVSGTKTWDGLEKGETAPTVTVQLQKWDSDSDEWTPVTDVATQEVDNEGTYTFSDLPKYELVDGTYVEVEYRVVELNPEEGVTPSGGTKDEDGNYDLTNMMDTTSVTITKVWDDQDDKYGLRPSTTDFTVTLTDQANANRTYTASDWTVSEDDSNVWTVTIDNVRTHDVAGNKLTYTVSENVAEPYTASHTPETIKPADVESEVEVTVTNTLKTMDVIVNKTWDLNGIELEEYPEIKLELRHDNQMVAETTLTTTDLTGSVTFANVPYREEGYTVVETSITGGTFPEGTLNAPSGGVASLFPTLASAEVVLVDGKYTASLTNTAKDGSGNELGAMTVTKVLDLNGVEWEGDTYPSFEFGVLIGEGNESIALPTFYLTPAEQSDGTISATSGQILAVVGASVTVDEVTQPGWTADKTSDKVTIGETPANVTFTNTRDVVTSLTVTKVWDVPADMTMPTPALSVEITRSVEGGTGETVVAGIALSESNEWSWTAEGTFPTHDENGNAYIYSATEEAADPAEQSVLAQYDLTVGTAKPAEGGTKIVLTNTISDGDTVTVTVQKVVVDESGTTPNDKTFAISYTVNSNGTQVASGTLELANNGSQDIIVPKGAKVTVTETPGEGWTVSYSNNDGTAFNENGTITVTNKRKSTSVDVTKVWVDGNAYQTRPSVADFEGMLALYSTTDDWETSTLVTNASPSVTPVEGSSSEWTIAYSNLPDYDLDGKKYTYAVVETLPEDSEYVQSFSVDTAAIGEATGVLDEGTIINTLTGTVDVTVTKTWVDDGNAQKGRPAEDVFAGWLTLYRTTDDWASSESVTVEADDLTVTAPEGSNNWTVTYSGLDKYDANGNAYIYAVVETVPEDSEYVQSFSGDTAAIGEATGVLDEGTIINTLTGTVNVTVNKVWNDGDGALDSSLIPSDETITIVIYQGVEELEDQALTLSSENGWKDSVTGLPKYDANGALYEYTVAEQGAENGVITIDGKKYTVAISESAETANSFTVTNTRQSDDEPTKPVKTYDEDVENKFDMVEVEEQIVYTISYTNHLNVPATVKITDVLDAGVDFVDATGYSTPVEDVTVEYVVVDGVETVIWTIENVEAFGTGTVTLTVKVNGDALNDADLTITNTATAQVGNDSSTSEEVDITVYNPSLDVEKKVTNIDEAPFELGDEIDYTVTVTNNGNVTLEDIAFEDDHLDEQAMTNLPEGASLGNGQIVIEELGVGNSISFDYTYTVTSADILEGKVTNTATATADDPTDPSKPDITDTDTTETDLDEVKATFTVEKTSDVTGSVGVNDTITYTIVVTNTGNVPLTNVVVDDKLDGVTFVQSDDYTINGDGNAVIDTLAVNASVTLTATYTVTAADVAAGYVHNEVTANGINPDPDGEDPTGGDETYDPTDPVKEVDTTGNVAVDDTLTYTIHYFNHNDAAVDVKITDVLDPGLDFVSASDGGTYTFDEDEGTRTVTWTLENVEAHTSGTVTLTVEVNETAKTQTEGEKEASVSNDATVTVGDREEITNEVTNPLKDDDPTDPTKTVTGGTTVYDEDGTMVNVGDELTYTISWTNHLNHEATVVITDELDPNVEYVDATVTAPANGKVAHENGVVTWTINAAAYETGKVTVTVRVKDSALDGSSSPTVENEATVVIDNTIKQETEPVKTTVANPAIGITKSISNGSEAPFELDDEIEYTVKVTNTGNVTLTDIELTDSLSEDLTIETLPEGATYDQDGWIVIEELEPEASIIFTYTYTVTSGDILTGKVDNTARVTADDPTKSGDETVSAEDDATADLDDVNAGIEVTKTADKTGPLVEGDVITYTITVENTGNVALKNIDVVDALEGVAFTQTSGTVSSESGNTVTITVDGAKVTIAELAAYDSIELTATYTVTAADVAAGHVHNGVTVTTDEVPDPDDEENPQKPEDKDDIDLPTVPTKALVSGADEDGFVNVGDELTYTISYYNYNDEAATVVITDKLDSGVTFVSASDEGDESNGTVTWRLNVEAHTGGTVTLVVEVNETAKLQVAGETVASVSNDATVTIGNYTATTNEVTNPLKEDDPEKPTKTVADATDATVTNGSNVEVGDELTYTISYYNHHNAAATVVITDVLDPGVTLVWYSGSASNDTTADGRVQLTWTIANVPALTAGSVTVTVRVNETAKLLDEGETQATVENTANVKVGNDDDVNTDTVENPIKPENPQDPTKTATEINNTTIVTTDGVEVEVGDEITYQIAYRNYTNERQTLTITDVLDEGVDLVRATSDSENGITYEYANHTVTWTITNVAPFTNGSVTLTVRVNETAKEVGTDEMVATVDNAASLTIGKTTTTSDTVIIPVKDDEPTDPTKEATKIEDVEITTTQGVTVEVGDAITYEIAYTNHTADRVTVRIVDELDDGVDFFDATGYPATEGNVTAVYDDETHTVTWTITGVAPFTSGSVELTVEVNETAKEVGDGEDLATVDNTAYVTIGGNDPEQTNTVDIPLEDDDPTDPTKEATEINDVEITTTDGQTVEVGDEITYVIGYTNHTADRVDVTIRDVLDGGVDYVGATGNPTDGNVTAVYDDETHTVTWTITGVAPFTDGSVTLTVLVTEDAKKTEPGEELATVDNTAYVAIGDGETEFETKPVEIPVEPDDPEKPEKSSDIEDSGNSFGMIEVGDQIVYTIEYYNNLNVPANVTVIDHLDSGVDFVSAGNGGSYDSATHTVTWTIQNVAPFTTGTVTLTVVVNESAIDGSEPTVTNTASAEVGNQSSFDSEAVEIPVYNPDVEIVKEVADNREESEQKGYYAVGETVEFEITVTNTGNVTLSNLVVSDDIHASGDAEIVAGTGYQIDADGNAVIAALEPGESVVVYAQYVVQVGDLGDEPVVNTASVTAPDPDDPDDPDEPPVEDEDEEEFTPDVTTEVTGSKIWNDLDNMYNTRPDSITVRLYADGAEYAVQTVTAASGWTYAFTGLPVHNADGTEIRYTVTEDAVTGYDTTLIPVGGDENASYEWEIQNDLQQYTLTVRYWYNEVGGRTAAPTVTGTYYYGQSYSVVSPRIPGYTSNPSVVSGVITGDVVRDVIYTAIDYTLTIYYVYEDGTTAAPTYTEVLNVNDDYYVVSPVLEGYVASRLVVSGTMPANNVVYTVIYVPETETVEIDRDGVSLNIGSVVMNVGDCFE